MDLREPERQMLWHTCFGGEEFDLTGAWTATWDEALEASRNHDEVECASAVASRHADIQQEDDVLLQSGIANPPSHPGQSALQDAEVDATALPFPENNDADWWSTENFRPLSENPWSVPACVASSPAAQDIPEVRVFSGEPNETGYGAEQENYSYGIFAPAPSMHDGDFERENELAYEMSHLQPWQNSQGSSLFQDPGVGPSSINQHLAVGSQAPSGSSRTGTLSFVSDNSTDIDDAATDLNPSTPMTPFTTASSSQQQQRQQAPQQPAYHTTPDGKFRCAHPKCQSNGKMYELWSRFHHHWRNHGPRRYACGLCSKSFHFPKDLRRHMRRVTHSQRAFRCQECGIPFGREDHLARHRASACGRAVVIRTPRSSSSATRPRSSLSDSLPSPSPSPTVMAVRSRGNAGGSGGAGGRAEAFGLGLTVPGPVPVPVPEPAPPWNCPTVPRPMPSVQNLPMFAWELRGLLSPSLPPPLPPPPLPPTSVPGDYFQQRF